MSRFSLDGFFELKASGTTVKQEILGGLTTFVAMSYLIFVVPAMLADAGMNREAATAATILVTVVASALMGVYANLPIAVGPGLGISAYFAYYICGPAGFSWQAGLAAVFISGVVFFILTVTRIRQLIIDAIPPDLKIATSAGIGCFIALIGMKNCGLIVSDASGLSLGDVCQPSVVLAVLGFFATAAMMIRKIAASIILGIALTAAAGFVCGLGSLPEEGFFSATIPDFSQTFLVLDFGQALEHGLVTIVFTLTVVDLFDNIGPSIGLSHKANLVRPDGSIKKLDKAFVTDSFGTMFSGIVGTTTAVQYLESATGIAAGARTGLSTVVTALLFAASVFVIPLVSSVPVAATAPALVMVGVLMMQEVVNIRFADLRIAVSAFLMILGMPVTFNIATGFGFGFIAYVLLSFVDGRRKEVKPAMVVIALAFAVNFALK